jgi:putative peptide zinc metalloprotease protein
VSAALTSSSWYRVAGLRPRLRTQARLYRHRYRSEVWYLLQDPATGRVHRFTPAARLVIAAMDGRRSVDELWELANRHLGETAPTQDEMISLLGQLHATDLLQSDASPDVAELFERGERQDKSRRRRSYMNPMAVRIPLWDPEAFLNRVNSLIRHVWGPWGAVLWLAVVLPALLLLPAHWLELSNNLSDRVLAVDNLLLLGLVFPVIKALHEFGHASATKAGGGEVHDMGVMFLVLMPVPYVDASAATAFKSKYQRALVGAGGMLVELFVAALAFYLWLLVEPGPLRAVLFNVMAVAGVSTVIFNGNPLLRYDAYYILADLIEMPNLAQRSLRYWSYLLERRGLGLADVEAPPATAGEKAWFVFYGLASSIYRILVTVAIALFIAGKFFVIGVVLALWALVAMAVVPLVKGIRYLAASPRLHRQRRRAMLIAGGAAAALLLFVAVIPMPFRSQAEGIVWLPDEAMVRAGGNGFVRAYLADFASRVERGSPLVQSHDPALEAQIAVAEGKVAELEAVYAAQFVANRAQAEIVRDQLTSEAASLDRLRERATQLIALAGTEGVFVAPRGLDMPGRYVRKGEVLGYVSEKGGRGVPIARVAVAQGDVDMVRLATDRVQVRLAQDLATPVEGRIVRQVPAGEDRLPSRALAPDGGGQIAVDPRDGQGTKALERIFQFDIELLGAVPLDLFGERVHVRFEHRWEPLAQQWYRGLRRVFLSHFHV